MPVKKLKEFLDGKGVNYESIPHIQTFTAQRTAQATHIRGKEMAKTLIVKLDGRMAMVVIPAHHHLSIEALKAATGACEATLADEKEFTERFPGCEIGAMPPFGNLYEMKVYLQEQLAEDDEIGFNAGTHTEVIRLAYQDFETLVNPEVGDYTLKP